MNQTEVQKKDSMDDLWISTRPHLYRLWAFTITSDMTCAISTSYKQVLLWVRFPSIAADQKTPQAPSMGRKDAWSHIIISFSLLWFVFIPVFSCYYSWLICHCFSRYRRMEPIYINMLRSSSETCRSWTQIWGIKLPVDAISCLEPFLFLPLKQKVITLWLTKWNLSLYLPSA